jgi:hypothetical protein
MRLGMKLCLACLAIALYLPSGRAWRPGHRCARQPLIGYGLMVGLDGSGDQTRRRSPQNLNNMLSPAWRHRAGGRSCS